MTKTIFIDESGNCDLDSGKKSGTNLFVIAAIIVESDDLVQQREKVRAIISTHVGKGELKSSKIGSNHERRIKIIQSLDEIPYKVYSLIVDRNLISKETGLRYKRSFVKYINGMVCEKLFSAFQNIEIKADKSGGQDFQTGLKNYILRKKSDSILFDASSFDLVDSSTEPFIQIADLIAGTIAKIQNKSTPEAITLYLMDTFDRKLINIDYWPPYKKSIAGRAKIEYINGEAFTQNEIIKRYSIDSAVDYLNSNPSFGDKDVEIRLCVLRYLLYQIGGTGANSFVYSNQIIRHVKELLGISLNVHGLSSKVISKLRDDGVIISSGEKGYKIPCTLSDIIEYIKTTDSKVIPMLKRIKSVSDSIQLTSNGEINLIDENSSEELKAIVKLI